MTVNAIKDGTKLTITAEGKLGTTSAPELEKAVKDNIGGVTELIFDFGNLEYMASAGLRVLLTLSQKEGSKVKLIHASEVMREILDETGFSGLFDVE